MFDATLLGINIAPVGFIATLVIGGVCGFLASTIMKGAGMGVLMNIIVGILGAMIFGFLFTNFSLVNPLVDQIIGGTVGAMILLFLMGLVRR